MKSNGTQASFCHANNGALFFAGTALESAAIVSPPSPSIPFCLVSTSAPLALAIILVHDSSISVIVSFASEFCLCQYKCPIEFVLAHTLSQRLALLRVSMPLQNQN